MTISAVDQSLFFFFQFSSLVSARMTCLLAGMLIVTHIPFTIFSSNFTTYCNCRLQICVILIWRNEWVGKNTILPDQFQFPVFSTVRLEKGNTEPQSWDQITFGLPRMNQPLSTSKVPPCFLLAETEIPGPAAGASVCSGKPGRWSRAIPATWMEITQELPGWKPY